MKSVTSKKRRYLPIDAVFNKVTKGSAESLLAVHALTGCDTTSYIAKHIKPSSRKIFKEHHGLLKNLCICDLKGNHKVFRNICLQNIQYVYRTDAIDAARILVFSKTGKPVQAMDPTSDALRFHLTKVHYEAMIW